MSRIKKYLADRNGIDRSRSLESIVNYCSSNNYNTIKLIMLWGASNKLKATKADKDALLYLIHFIHELEGEFKKNCKLKIIFTDTHVHLNGYDLDIMESYFSEIKYHLRKHDFTYTYCSSILKNYINELGYSNWKEFILNILKQPMVLFKSTNISEQQASKFKNYAIRHCNRLDGIGSLNEIRLSADAASKAYLYLSSIEKEVIGKSFSDSMFITYMNKEEDFILPNLTIARIYTIKSGLRTRPWFSN